MVQIKSSSFLLTGIFSLLYSVTEAFPILGDSLANWTLPLSSSSSPSSSSSSSLPFSFPFNFGSLPGFNKRDEDVVIQATSTQIAEYKKYAGIASAAYCSSVTSMKLWNCAPCVAQVPDGKLIKTFKTPTTDTNGFVLRSDNDKTIYLVFRGTFSVQQAIVDATGTFVNYSPASGASVHAGFYSSVKEATTYYFSTVQSQLTQYPSYRVVVTGHSLGAAQALLAGLDLYQRDTRFTKNNLFIHTQGCPRVGNPAFAKYVQSTGITYSRSVNQRDIVPHVPSKTLGFLHAGYEIWAKTSSNIVICTSTIESSKCSDTIPDYLTNTLDHLTYYGISEGVCV